MLNSKLLVTSLALSAAFVFGSAACTSTKGGEAAVDPAVVPDDETQADVATSIDEAVDAAEAEATDGAGEVVEEEVDIEIDEPTGDDAAAVRSGCDKQVIAKSASAVGNPCATTASVRKALGRRPAH